MVVRGRDAVRCPRGQRGFTAPLSHIGRLILFRAATRGDYYTDAFVTQRQSASKDTGGGKPWTGGQRHATEGGSFKLQVESDRIRLHRLRIVATPSTSFQRSKGHSSIRWTGVWTCSRTCCNLAPPNFISAQISGLSEFMNLETRPRAFPYHHSSRSVSRSRPLRASASHSSGSPRILKAVQGYRRCARSNLTVPLPVPLICRRRVRGLGNCTRQVFLSG